MSLRTHLVAIAVAFAVFFGGASQAQAAKGVKKKTSATAEHHHNGKVVAVDHKSGIISIQEHHKAKKKTARTQVHKFTVTSTTKVFTGVNKQRKPSNFAAVHKGEHVSIAARNHHADTVVIHSKVNKTKKKAAKKKKK